MEHDNDNTAPKNGSSVTNEPFLGERAVIRGTGQWWSGSNFRVTIVDMDDKTVKVQYSDGGYKRFSRGDFLGLKIENEGDSGALAFGSQDYEWADDAYNPLTEVETELSGLQEQLRYAVQHRSFLKAEDLKNKIRSRQEALGKIQQLEHSLRQHVMKEEFVEANTIQTEIIEIQKGQKLAATPELNLSEIASKAGKRALGGGFAGALAMVVQVSSLMWLRTTMNYQYRYGISTKEALSVLYKDGGVRRFYRGVGPALLQGPLSRFGDTAANVGMLTLLNSFESTRDMPIGVKTFFASGTAALWRICLMPIDTVKTTFQVEGASAWQKLMAKRKVNGNGIFYHGALGASSATFAGHYPWFATFNFLDSVVPVPDQKLKKLSRNAGIGFISSVVSDSLSNSLRVLKTYRQTSEVKVSYPQAARQIIDQEGVIGLLGRGLKTRILTNGLQGLMFSVAWKFLDEEIKKRTST